MFSIRAKQQTIHSISASGSSKFQFHICFRSSRSDYLSVFHDEDTVFFSPPRKRFTLAEVSVSGSRQTRPSFYPIRQLHATMCLQNKKHRISVRASQTTGQENMNNPVIFLTYSYLLLCTPAKRWI